MNKILVVGAGFAGATIARQLAEHGYLVSVIDQRSHIAGNAFDEWTEHGILKHRFGPHIFHTNNKSVFEWLSKFTEWNDYKHKVLALLGNGELVVIPPNSDTLCALGSKTAVVDQLFRPYSLKMWGVSLDELSPDIINRVKIREDLNEYYFPDDKFQVMPKNGYTALVANILDHPNIEVTLESVFEKSMQEDFTHTFSSQAIDEYFDFKYGSLPYRSIKFHDKFIPHPSINPVPTVNFTHDGSFTRVTEWKKFPGHGENTDGTLLTFEEPCDYTENNMERYYPVKDLDGLNRDKYHRYQALQDENITFIGRLGLYVYLDMHQAINSSLAIADKFLKKAAK